MRQYKVEYSNGDGIDTAFVVANNREKALKAFHLKVAGVDDDQVLGVEPASEADLRARMEPEMEFGDEPIAPIAGGGPRRRLAPAPRERGGVLLGVLGIIQMIAGGVLLGDPTLGENVMVANLQLLTIGQTLFITGAIFAAVQWRPR
ncbi:MOSC domain-containing protein YiiM [Natronocella acetinitrilica]|uniref:MOSC domain-containing protein YiiM n=1 Tax=Natronocella acetinitrilica TaxID=414046 RepID=A0AAE3G5S4_9GAMM|nr:hypothetical protein [Natronocella acetinitrilica]MCP1674382.1 MOSC domain-containing protein YiiM [Natronocella acetinitrilica]